MSRRKRNQETGGEECLVKYRLPEHRAFYLLYEPVHELFYGGRSAGSPRFEHDEGLASPYLTLEKAKEALEWLNNFRNRKYERTLAYATELGIDAEDEDAEDIFDPPLRFVIINQDGEYV